jgi:hypothetical protein
MVGYLDPEIEVVSETADNLEMPGRKSPIAEL